VNAGCAHLFRGGADLGVTKTNGQVVVVPGEPITYTIVASNAGPNPAPGATVTDILPIELLGATWTCVASAGSTCTGAGSGNVNDVITLLVGGTATYTVTATVDPAADGSIYNLVDLTPPAGVPDPDLSDNYDIDSDPLGPRVDLSATKTDSADPVQPGDPLTYVVGVTNGGPSNGTDVTVEDTLPAGVTFVSSVPGPPTCTLAGATLTCILGDMVVGATAAVTINVTVDAGASGILVNTATASGDQQDPDFRNNTATAGTSVGRRDGELSHGTNEVYDLAANPGPLADEDVFRLKQNGYSSYEIVVDGTSGDIGANDASFLTRLAPDGTTVLQVSAPIGAGFSRSLRWMNTTAIVNEGEMVRVRSTECTTDCGTDDVYRIRAYETTCAAPRFNNTGTQVTVLVLQNPTTDSISGYAYFRGTSGALVGTQYFALSPMGTAVINTSWVPGAAETSGAITVAHDGRYGELSGKTVALEPATGFSFDTPLVPRLP
jgi:uncharacterized repeat protein (TIGR01451 family)